MSPSRLLLLGVALALSAYLLWRNRDELTVALGLLGRVDPGWLAAAGLVEVTMLAAIIGGYQALFVLAGYWYPIGRLLVVWLATNMVNQAVPSAGVVAAVFFVAWTPRTVPAGITLYAIAAHGYLDYLAFAGLTITTLGISAGREHVPWPILVAGALSIAVSLAGTLLAVRLLRERGPVERGVRRTLGAVSRLTGRLSHHLAFDPERAAAQVIHGVDGLAEALRRGPGVLVPLGLAVAVQVLRPAQVVALSHAVRAPVDLVDAAAAYISAGLATYWTFLPGGIGVYAGTLAEILSRVVAYPAAAAISIAQRTLNFWAPMLAGVAAFFGLQIRRNGSGGPPPG